MFIPLELATDLLVDYTYCYVYYFLSSNLLFDTVLLIEFIENLGDPNTFWFFGEMFVDIGIILICGFIFSVLSTVEFVAELRLFYVMV